MLFLAQAVQFGRTLMPFIVFVTVVGIVAALVLAFGPQLGALTGRTQRYIEETIEETKEQYENARKDDLE
jgi:uncharacterized membrane protein (DUF106 family)